MRLVLRLVYRYNARINTRHGKGVNRDEATDNKRVDASACACVVPVSHTLFLVLRFMLAAYTYACVVHVSRPLTYVHKRGQ